MSRRIIVGLDGTEYTANATRVACLAADAFDGTLVGVAVVDEPGIDASARGAGIGASHYAKRTREKRLTDAEARAEQMLEMFEQTCKNAGAKFELAHHHGVPFRALADESRYADLLVVGTRTNFHIETSEGYGDTLQLLMQKGVCPVLAVPTSADLPKRAIIAYDGSVQSARAMRAYVQFASINPGRGDVVLLHVGESSKSEDHVQFIRAQKYISGYGFSVELVRRDGKPSKLIAEVANEFKPSLIVMGAYGSKGVIKKIFFGSTASQLLKDEKFPILVYH